MTTPNIETLPLLKPAPIGPRPQLKILGIFLLFLTVAIITAIVEPTFLDAGNLRNILRRTSLYAILGIGVAFVIITGGIDLSIGSVVALIGCLLALFIQVSHSSVDQAEILEINQGTKYALVADNFSHLKKGDLLHLTPESGDKAILTVEKATFDPAYTALTGIPQAVTNIDLAEPAKYAVSVGKLTRAARVTKVDPDAKTLYVHSDFYSPSRYDRITAFRATGSDLVDLNVTSVRRAEPDGTLAVTVRDIPSIEKANQWAFVTFQQHHQKMAVPMAITLLLLLSAAIGLTHGLLITKLRLQPFVVTLCGLLIYRGVIRWISRDQVQGFGSSGTFDDLRYLAVGEPFWIPLPRVGRVQIPMPTIIMAVLAIVAAILLNRTIFGRYLLALGRNEQAARFSGINTDRTIIAAYVISALCAGFGGMIFILEVNSGQPSDFGNFYELYAIAAAVLGGCSLRGGEGSIPGVVIGAGLMILLYNAINLLGIPTTMEFAIIGAVILFGVMADELVKRYAAKRRATRAAA